MKKHEFIESEIKTFKKYCKLGFMDYAVLNRLEAYFFYLQLRKDKPDLTKGSIYQLISIGMFKGRVAPRTIMDWVYDMESDCSV